MVKESQIYADLGISMFAQSDRINLSNSLNLEIATMANNSSAAKIHFGMPRRNKHCKSKEKTTMVEGKEKDKANAGLNPQCCLK